MKRSLGIVLGIFFLLCSTSCKYDEGPIFSLRSAEKRLVNSWKFKFMQFNGANGLNGNGPGSINFGLSTIGFNTENRFSVTWQYVNDTKELLTGTWSFADDNEVLVLEYDDMPDRTQTFKITKLKNDDLWLEESIGNDLYEYKLDGEE